jgi:septum formation protein
MGIHTDMKWKVILGSASPRRQQLLKALFPGFIVRTHNSYEDFPAELKEQHIPLFLAKKKAKGFIGELHEDEIVITADTIVWLEDMVLNKPADRNEALEMLMRLSGNMHKVFTGICLTSKTKSISLYVESDVYFRNLSAGEIKFYVNEYSPFDKAGSYGAQECLKAGVNPLSEEEKSFLKRIDAEDLFERTKSVIDKKQVAFIDHIEGSYFNVMGLPIVELYQEIQSF